MEKNLHDRLSIGIKGLDEILYGGLIPGRAYLVRGGPGTGKTTLGLHFLTDGAKNGEKVLFITLGEPESEIRKNAYSFGFSLNEVNFLDLSPTAQFFAKVETYDIFSPAEVERGPITQMIVEQIEKLKPKRIFLDAMTQFRYLTTDLFQFRKQVLSFLRFLKEQENTVLFTSEASAQAPDEDLQFLSDGVIHLTFGLTERTISVTKFRGSDFHLGCHGIRLSNKGIKVFPKLRPEKYLEKFIQQAISSGIQELDDLLHGGLEKGTTTLISGPSGVGKTTLGLQFMKKAAERGDRAVVFTFGEMAGTIINRSQAVNIPVHNLLKSNLLEVIRVEQLRVSPDEFTYQVRCEVEEKKTRLVMIDSVSGYRLSLKGENLVYYLHALNSYLVNMKVTVLLINEMKNITGEFRVTDMGIEYLADNIIFLRYLEKDGQLHKAVGVLKKRVSDFEKSLREFEITSQGIKVGKPLTGLRGFLTGIPTWEKFNKELTR